MSIYRVPINIIYTGAGAPGVNVWHVRTGAGADDQGNLNSQVAAIHTFYDSLKSYAPQSQSWTLGTITNVDTQEEKQSTFAAVVGGSLAGYAPQALCVVIQWKTSIAARRGRGRTFFGPVHNSIMQTDGTVDNTSLTAIRNAAAALVAQSVAGLNGAIVVWGLVDPQGDAEGPPADLPHIARDVTGYSVRDIFGVLRSRRD